MKELSRAEREQQRVAHLVLGQARPKPTRRVRRRTGQAVLAPGIEERVQLRERWSHKQGTPETLEHVDQVRSRPGSLARLYRSGAINAEQLAAATAIAGIHERIGADVAVKTASLETRIDGGWRGDGSFYEALGLVRREVAYTRWRRSCGQHAAALLDMIAGDEALTIVAQRWRMSNRRICALLIEALDRWAAAMGEAAAEVDPATLAAAHAGLLA